MIFASLLKFTLLICIWTLKKFYDSITRQIIKQNYKISSHQILLYYMSWKFFKVII